MIDTLLKQFGGEWTDKLSAIGLNQEQSTKGVGLIQDVLSKNLSKVDVTEISSLSKSSLGSGILDQILDSFKDKLPLSAKQYKQLKESVLPSLLEGLGKSGGLGDLLKGKGAKKVMESVDLGGAAKKGVGSLLKKFF